MPLISCPTCGQQVSTDAIACPHCGHPLQSSKMQTVITKPAEDSVQTIQRTKKKWKKLRLWGFAFFAIGLICMFNHLWPLGLLLWIVAIGVGITANIGSWWSTG